MSYAEAISQLNAMVPELYASPGQPRRKFSLEEIRILLAALGDPHRRFPAVLIAGTTGKGSTASSLASILTSSGLRAGLYTSPHLARVNERIRLNRVQIPDDSFAALYFRVHDAAQELVLAGRLAQMPSFFEMLTAQALLYFAENQVDIAVLEVGMGGRLDATNIVDPLISVITDISLDHTEWLGSTITAITREKAGILRPHGTLVTLPQHPEANQVIGEIATNLGVRGVSATAYMPPMGTPTSGPYTVEVLGTPVRVDSPLSGAHQHRNLALAIATAVELASTHNYPITAATIAEGLRLTRWPGRLEHISHGGVEWILDVAHNPAGAWALRAGINNNVAFTGAGLNGQSALDQPRTLIFSCLRDKPIAEMAQILFPVFDRVILVPMHAARAATMDELAIAAKATGSDYATAHTVAEALALASRQQDSGVIVVSGSVYLVGEARSLLLQNVVHEGANPEQNIQDPASNAEAVRSLSERAQP
jgi:dihydrofolate synthase/folylpolyglutamate synthase